MFNKMKQVIIKNTLNTTNYTISFILDFILYPSNARIRELPSVDVSQLEAIQIPFVFENLTSGKVIIKDVIITSNDNIITDNFVLQTLCCFNKESLVFNNEPVIMCNTNITYKITPNDNFFITFFIEKVFKRRKLVPIISSSTSSFTRLENVATSSNVSSVATSSNVSSVRTSSDVSSVATSSNVSSVATSSNVSSVATSSDVSSVATSSDVSSLCIHQKFKYQCKICSGKQSKKNSGSHICPHNRKKIECKECGGKNICPHNRRKYTCKECNGSQICPHNRRKYTCKECNGKGICLHNRRKYYCKECNKN